MILKPVDEEADPDWPDVMLASIVMRENGDVIIASDDDDLLRTEGTEATK